MTSMIQHQRQRLISSQTLFCWTVLILIGIWNPSRAQAQSQVADTSISDTQLREALDQAKDNREEIRRALEQAPPDQRAAMRFLVAYMPERDLQSLSADYLLENVSLAFHARNSVPWGSTIPEEIFFNDILPYASVNETRDRWRADFVARFLPMVQEARTPGEAAQILNRDIFPLLNVKYHATKRPKPDQSPFESIEAQYASCSGLSILLIDACRAVCVPARFVGTPRWATKRGNHSWVEVWDGQAWQFTGACEYNETGLSRTWFQADAAQAVKDDPRKAIYASSWRKTGLSFPLVWNREIDYVAALNVTDRYTGKSESSLPDPEEAMVAIQLWDSARQERLTRQVEIFDRGESVATGSTKGAKDDTNHWLEFRLRRDHDYQLRIASPSEGSAEHSFRTTAEPRQSFDFALPSSSSDGDTTVTSPLAQWRQYLALDRDKRPPLSECDWAKSPLNSAQVEEAARLWWTDHAAWIRQTRAEEMANKVITHGEWKLRFDYSVHGEKPATGRSLFLSLHGGGGAPTRVNDRQWENQKTLYTPEEGVYVAPRAPTDTWNLWHQDHIDPLFDRLIEAMIVFEDVNPDRVYLMGYSAGGDGVFQLAPRMADRWAAAAMMAGHPNETSPLGLRNIGFTLHMGGEDTAYRRHEVAREWRVRLAELHEADPEGYRHDVAIHEGLGHWMQKKDAVAVPWMAAFRRHPYPDKMVWKQDDVLHDRFYWIALPEDQRQKGSLLRASIDGQTVEIVSSEIQSCILLLHDALVDLDRPVRVVFNDKVRFESLAARTLLDLERSFRERPDPRMIYPTRIIIPPQS